MGEDEEMTEGAVMRGDDENHTHDARWRPNRVTRGIARRLRPWLVVLGAGPIGCIGELPPLPQVPDTASTTGTTTGNTVASTTGPGTQDSSGTMGDTEDGTETGPGFDPVCGDSIIEGDEECDLGPDNVGVKVEAAVQIRRR